MSEQPQEVHIVLLSDSPARAYPAFQLALAATALGSPARVYLTSDALRLVKQGEADKVQMPGMPTLGQLLKDSLKMGVEVCACGPSIEFLKQMGITEETVEPGVKLEDAVTFLKKALPASKQGGIVTFI
jgi:predicted peroxiredoxin